MIKGVPRRESSRARVSVYRKCMLISHREYSGLAGQSSVGYFYSRVKVIKFRPMLGSDSWEKRGKIIEFKKKKQEEKKRRGKKQAFMLHK